MGKFTGNIQLAAGHDDDALHLIALGKLRHEVLANGASGTKNDGGGGHD
ncbi:hypothetical protein GCM10007157_19030 [Vreelandella hamiltonii]|uniref:Uncharacterized protein n=1 Tax=Vreelandella hamiltonii TaxID=502829 RepID=A0A8H9LZV9_9GAMM|nr:hypothetical protein GCM10007157_19030 [Halomonas hamiltonii]